MVKKLLLNLLGGVLFMGCCSDGKASEMEFSSIREVENRHSRSNESEQLESDDSESEESGQSQTVESSELPFGQEWESGRPPVPVVPPPSKPAPAPAPERKVVPIVCSERVLAISRSDDCCFNDLWQAMLDLKEEVLRSNGWEESVGIRNLVYHLAQRYDASKNQDEKDAIALYFIDTSERYAGELAGGSDDEAEQAEQDAIDFVKECLGDEEEE